MNLTKEVQKLDQAKEDQGLIEITDQAILRAKEALNSVLIHNLSIDQIKPTLLLIYSLVGLRPQFYPSGEEKEQLHQYVQKKYAQKTLPELVLAFDLAINGELDLKPDDVKVYDQFTIAYLAGIMSAYKKWLRIQAQNFKPKPMIQIEDKRSLTDEEKAEWIGEWQQMEEINIELIPLLFYDFLVEKEIIKPTPAEKKLAMEKAMDFIKKTLHEEMSVCKTNDAFIAFNQFQNQEKNGFTGDFKNRILNRAKRFIVFDYLNTPIR